MTVSHIGIGTRDTQDSGTCNPDFTGTGAGVAGDGLLLVVYCYNGGTGSGDIPASNPPSGWSQVANATANALYNFSKVVAVFFYSKDVVTGSESGSVAVVNTFSANISAAIIRVRADSGVVSFAGTNGTYTSGSSPTVVNFGSNPGLTADDQTYVAVTDNGTDFSAEALTATGVTFSGETEYFDAGTGQMDVVLTGHRVATGTASASPVWTGPRSLAYNPGCGALVRVREVPGGAFDPMGMTGFFGF